MKKFREFREWPLEKVEEVAQMFYAVAPFKRELWNEEYRWKSLARQAFDFLDNLHEACEEIAEQRKKQGEHYAAVSAELAEADKLPEIVPFAKAVRFITSETRTERALSKFKKVLVFNARRKPVPLMRPHDDPVLTDKWACFLPNLPAKQKRKLDAQLEAWQKNGIPRDDARNLKSLFEDEWPLVIAEGNIAKTKRRAKRTDKRRGAKTPELRAALKIPTAI